MSKNDGFLSMLGLARRAGKLSLGFDSAVGSVIKGESVMLLIARDISPKTEKELRYAVRDRQIDIYEIPYSIDSISAAIGKSVRVISINDGGFAKRLKQLLYSGNGEEFSV